MAWDKKTWVTGEVITADKLNRLEDGVEEACFPFKKFGYYWRVARRHERLGFNAK